MPLDPEVEYEIFVDGAVLYSLNLDAGWWRAECTGCWQIVQSQHEEDITRWIDRHRDHVPKENRV